MCELVNAIHKGIYDANLDYEQWSRGECWLNDSGCEGFMVAGIARALADQRHGVAESLQFERPFDKIRGRVDIALLHDGKPTCVIEAKRLWIRRYCENDLNRITELISGDCVRRGVLAVLVTGEGQALHDRRLEQAQEEVQRWAQSHANVNAKPSVSKSWGYPMFWPSGIDYPRWKEWRNWRGASICIEVTRP